MEKGKSKRPLWLPKRERKPTGNSEYYHTSAHKTLRMLVILRDVVCQECGAPYEKRKYFQCDHIKPISEGGDKYDLNNMQLLCKRCHDSKSATEGNKRRYLKWD